MVNMYVRNSWKPTESGKLSNQDDDNEEEEGEEEEVGMDDSSVEETKAIPDAVADAVRRV
jgi:hypothetical protein